MKITGLIKFLIAALAILAGINIVFSELTAQANNERAEAYEIRRAFTLAVHQMRISATDLTKKARAYVVTGNEFHYQMYVEGLRDSSYIGIITQVFHDLNATLEERELLYQASTILSDIRSLEAEAFEAKAENDSEHAVALVYSQDYSAFVLSFIDTYLKIYDSLYERTQLQVKNTENQALMMAHLTQLTSTLFAAVSIVGALVIFQEVRKTVKKEREVLSRQQLIYDSIPIPASLWDRDYNVFDCNEAMVHFLGVSDKEEALGRFFEFSTEVQPCGTDSKTKLQKVVDTALNEGSVRHMWTHLVDGKVIPVEVSAVRVLLDESNYSAACYTQDLRPFMEAADEIQKREIAEEESKAKTRFLARMSHEIRTPMNAVLGLTEIELQKGGHSKETEDVFLRIHSSSTLLLMIINDILDLSKVEAGKMEIIPAEYDTASFITDTVQLNLMQIGSKRIQFLLSVDEKLPERLYGDELRIKQILNNLLSNAFKYTNEGTVKLTVGVENHHCDNVIMVFKVEDTGQGMTTEQLANLHVDFVRFNVELNRTIEGVGLGMPISVQLIKMMNGDIRIDSEPGKGSVFTVRIPQKPCNCKLLGKEKAKNLASLKAPVSIGNTMKIPVEPMPQGKVLAVDDVEINLDVIQGILELYKINVEFAGSGSEALEKIKAGKVYDIIFMDHMMPLMDGMETTRRIRDLGYTHPIVALTANAVKDTADMFMNNGFSGYVSKPIDVGHLHKYLVRFIRDKEMEKEIEKEMALPKK